RTVHREEHRALAQFRRRADAVRAAVPCRRCRPHRAADRRQGTEPRGQRRGHAVRVAAAGVRGRPHRAHRALHANLPEADLGCGALLVVDDAPLAPLFRQPLRPPRADSRTRVLYVVATGASHHCRELRRPALRPARTTRLTRRAMHSIRFLAVIVLAGVMLSAPGEAGAWGSLGHRLVCAVALMQLDDEPRAEVERLAAAFRAPDGERYRYFTGGCNFADRARHR